MSFKVIEFAFVGYPVTDLAVARAFYETVLNLTPGSVFGDDKASWVEYEVGPHTLAISNMSPDWKPSKDGGEQMVVVPDGTPDAVHSVTYYSTTDTAGRRFAWVTLKPMTGRTHQLRVHMAELKTPILGDPRYLHIENWQPPEGLAEGLHLHARRITLPLRSGKILDVSAPLPPHMAHTFAALGFDPDRYDVQEIDPED